MSKTIITVIALCATLLIGVLVIGGIGVNIYNTQSTLRNTYEMKVKSNEAEFDNMWKKIQQTANVGEAQKEGFRQIFTDYAKGRTVEGAGKVMSWVKEAIPRVDLSIYKTILNIVTGSRDSWTSRQTELVDIARQYNQNLVTFPKNLILGMFGFQKIDPKIVTSSRTEKSFSDGKDDSVDLFSKPSTNK